VSILETREKILVVGSSGFLGNSLIRFYTKAAIFGISGLSKGEIVLTLGGKSAKEVMQYNFNNLAKIIEEVNPTTILNASGLVGDRSCSLSPEMASEANVKLPLMLGKIGNELGIQFIHFSTDAVFGQCQTERKEETLPNPDTVYGMTKLHGEIEASAILSKSLIIRTNFVGVDYLGQRGLFSFFSNAFVRRERVLGFRNVFFNPISIKYLCQNVDELRKKQIFGIIHLIGKSTISKYDFGKLVLESAIGQPLNVDKYIASHYVGDEVRLDMTLETTKMDHLDLPQGNLESEVKEMCVDRSRLLVEK